MQNDSVIKIYDTTLLIRKSSCPESRKDKGLWERTLESYVGYGTHSCYLALKDAKVFILYIANLLVFKYLSIEVKIFEKFLHKKKINIQCFSYFQCFKNEKGKSKKTRYFS